ncbi:MAG: tail tape measure protein, partial [Sphingobium sp.]
MDEEIERLVVSVRADVQGFARDVDAMRGGLEGPLAAGAERAGRAIESGLLRAVRTGKFGFEDLRRVASSVLDEIARSSLQAGIGAVGGGGAGGLLGIGASLLGSA